MSGSISNRLLAPEVYDASRKMKKTNTILPNPAYNSAYERTVALAPHSIVGATMKKPKTHAM